MDQTSYPLIEAKCSEELLTNITTDVNQPQQTEGLKVKVFVLSKQGQPLMPCTPAKAKHLLKEKKAKVVKRSPFTIQLNFECENQVQHINLGIDTGFGNIGFSATTEKEELICGTLVLDGKTKERLDEKRMYRVGRRARHHWYRTPRFSNRKRKEGWIPPSIQRRYDTHLSLIEKLKKILPISNVIVEVAKFDIQKIENPDIEGIGYQQGDLYDYQNIRSYLMSREKGKCQFCGKDFKGQSAHIHHIIPRSKGGNDRSSNLALLHENCHKELHRKGLEKKLKSNSKDYKHSTFMNIINKRFWNDITNLIVTYGHVTFVNRNKLGIEKTHYNDAFVISGGKTQTRIKPFEVIQKRKNNRCLQLNRKGFKPSIRKQRYPIQPKDLVWVEGKRYKVKGAHSCGKQIKVVNQFNKILNFSIKKIEKHFMVKTLIWN
jgi:hypothetical protein